MKSEPLITVIILTYNEEIHLERCLNSLKDIAKEVVLIDSFSTDRTLEIAKKLGATVLQNPWITYAKQYQWALDHVKVSTPWIMRMDADEFLTEGLITELKERMATISAEVSGLYINRRTFFMGKWMKRGGYYPMSLLRIWRTGLGRIEERWMDEHIKLSAGKTLLLENDLIDDNLNNLTWWTEKHNKYATREAVDLLNKKHHFFTEDTIDSGISSSAMIERRRWAKDKLYVKLPLFVRPFGYFFYRYFFKLGMLDGVPGLMWHALQGFWYRFLVDAKVYQIELEAKKRNMTVKKVLADYYNFEV